ncbi:MAG TPA: CPBP family intramembrane glutamic endopeptidase [Candidatus Acidoferrum sp.]|nr:CPBP family intramembrane glutamic endopeptidase [Candidatus Acidoferrum sp.]
MSIAWAALEVRLPAFGRWSRSGAGHCVLSAVQDAISVLTVLYFARTETVASFLSRFGLDRPPSDCVWFVVVVTLGVRAFGHVMISSGLARGVYNLSYWGFAHSIGFERCLYLAPTLIAPFSEELCIRGFVYRAFRGSYSIVLSTTLVLGFTAITHWGQVHHSWVAAVDIGAITLLQCFLRERTGSLWDCVICHLVFNAGGAFVSLLR